MKRPFSGSRKYGKKLLKMVKLRRCAHTSSEYIRRLRVLKTMVNLFFKKKFADTPLESDFNTMKYVSLSYLSFFFCSRLKLSPSINTVINQALFRGIFLCFQTPDAACYMKCPRCIFHSDSAVVSTKGTGVSLSSTGVLLFECL